MTSITSGSGSLPPNIFMTPNTMMASTTTMPIIANNFFCPAWAGFSAATGFCSAGFFSGFFLSAGFFRGVRAGGTTTVSVFFSVSTGTAASITSSSEAVIPSYCSISVSRSLRTGAPGQRSKILLIFSTANTGSPESSLVRTMLASSSTFIERLT